MDEIISHCLNEPHTVMQIMHYSVQAKHDQSNLDTSPNERMLVHGSSDTKTVMFAHSVKAVYRKMDLIWPHNSFTCLNQSSNVSFFMHLWVVLVQTSCIYDVSSKTLQQLVPPASTCTKLLALQGKPLVSKQSKLIIFLENMLLWFITPILTNERWAKSCCEHLRCSP